MSFLDFAKINEQNGMELYKKLATDIPIVELAGFFRFLAAEEYQHYEIFDAWQKRVETPDVDPSMLQGEPEELFRIIAAAFDTLGRPVRNYSEAYRRALEFERKGLNAYEQALDTLDDEEQRQQLRLIMEREKIHISLLISLLNFSREPDEMLEPAGVRQSEAYQAD